MLMRLPKSKESDKKKQDRHGLFTTYILMIAYEDLSVGRLLLELNGNGSFSAIETPGLLLEEVPNFASDPADHFVVPDGITESDADTKLRTPFYVDRFSSYRMKAREKRRVQKMVSLRYFYNHRLRATTHDPVYALPSSLAPENFLVTLDRLKETASDPSNLFRTPGFTM
jgi:hypothetical protein